MTARTSKKSSERRVGFEHIVAVGGDNLPEPLALEVFEGDLLAEVAVVAEQMLAERVGHDLIHIYTDSFHCFPD